MEKILLLTAANFRGDYRPSSLQTLLTLCPSLIRLTASSLNSIVYACFGIFISCLPKVTQFYATLGRRNFGGSSKTSVPLPPFTTGNHIFIAQGFLTAKGRSPMNSATTGMGLR